MGGVSMDVSDLLAEAKRLGITVQHDDGSLTLKGITKSNQAFAESLTRNKPAIIAHLNGDVEPPDDERLDHCDEQHLLPYKEFPTDALPSPLRELVDAGGKSLGGAPGFEDSLTAYFRVAQGVGKSGPRAPSQGSRGRCSVSPVWVPFDSPNLFRAT